MDVAQLVALAIGVLGCFGLIATALKYNRDDTTALITQQSMIVGEIQALNTELHLAVESLRAERDRCRDELSKLRRDV